MAGTSGWWLAWRKQGRANQSELMRPSCRCGEFDALLGIYGLAEERLCGMSDAALSERSGAMSTAERAL